jgi:hypothetical protein
MSNSRARGLLQAALQRPVRIAAGHAAHLDKIEIPIEMPPDQRLDPVAAATQMSVVILPPDRAAAHGTV